MMSAARTENFGTRNEAQGKKTLETRWIYGSKSYLPFGTISFLQVEPSTTRGTRGPHLQ